MSIYKGWHVTATVLKEDHIVINIILALYKPFSQCMKIHVQQIFSLSQRLLCASRLFSFRNHYKGYDPVSKAKRGRPYFSSSCLRKIISKCGFFFKSCIVWANRFQILQYKVPVIVPKKRGGIGKGANTIIDLDTIICSTVFSFFLKSKQPPLFFPCNFN